MNGAMARFGTRGRRANGWCVLILAGCCVLLAGCSAFYNYRFAGWWLRWQIEDYVRWSPAQEPLFRERLSEQLRWHQRTQLPRYRSWLEQLRERINGPLDAGQVSEQIEQVRAFWNDIMRQVEPDFDRFLADLSDRQARDVIDRLREAHADTVAEYARLSPEKYIDQRARDMRKGIERLTGTLDAEQRARILSWAQQIDDNRAVWLASRVRWIDTLERALARRSDSDYFAAQIHVLFIEPELSWDPEYRRRIDRNTALTSQLLADIHRSLNTRQREALEKNAGKWLGTLDELAREHY